MKSIIIKIKNLKYGNLRYLFKRQSIGAKLKYSFEK